MDLFKKIKNILSEILDISDDEIKKESYIVRFRYGVYRFS